MGGALPSFSIWGIWYGTLGSLSIRCTSAGKLGYPVCWQFCRSLANIWNLEFGNAAVSSDIEFGLEAREAGGSAKTGIFLSMPCQLFVAFW